jgi:hypothetical protein
VVLVFQFNVWQEGTSVPDGLQNSAAVILGNIMSLNVFSYGKK